LGCGGCLGWDAGVEEAVAGEGSGGDFDGWEVADFAKGVVPLPIVAVPPIPRCFDADLSVASDPKQGGI
jgi:hypothetical protein